MEHKIIADLLRQGGFLMVNKAMLKMFGVKNTLVLSIILDKGHVYNYEHFYCTREYIREMTGMIVPSITKIIAFWRDLGVITSVKEGVPAKTYYTINLDALVKTITPAFDTTSSEMENNLSSVTPSEYENSPASEYENSLTSEYENSLTYIDNKTPDNKTPYKKDIIINSTHACTRETVGAVDVDARNIDWEDVKQRWNQIAEKYLLPRLLGYSPQRKVKFIGTLATLETPTVDFFFAELERIMETSYFLRGIKKVEEKDGYRDEEATPWRPSFDWFITPGNFIIAREGKFGERTLEKKWERFHKKQTATEKEGVKDAEKGGAL